MKYHYISAISIIIRGHDWKHNRQISRYFFIHLAKKTGKKEIPAVYFRSIDTDKILAESPATQDPANEAAAKKKLMFDYSDLLPTNTNTNNLERTRLDGRSEETPIKLNTTQIK